MLRKRLLGMLFGALLASSSYCAADLAAPKLDRPKLEAYLRYAEGFSSEVQMAIDDPTASPFKGYYRVLVHLTAGAHKLDRLYYVSDDGQQFINGSIWNLNRSPFVATLEHLPTDGPSFGPPQAKVTIVVFSDFECPYCRELARTVRDNIPQKYPNDVRVVFKDFPIDAIHKWARQAAEAGQCLAAQKPSAFWAFHDWIFEHQQEVNEANLRDKVLAFAKEQNVDLTQLGTCMDSHATGQHVTDEQQNGAALQISKTPTLFVNGRMLDGAVTWATLDAVIKIELKPPGGIAIAAGEKCCEVDIPTATKK